MRALVAGDRVAVRGRLGPLDGYDARLRWRHLVARLDDGHLEDLAPARAPGLRAANGIRTLVARGGAGLPARERRLLAAFLLGDERAIPDGTVATFRAAGMSHLLVVSGANVAAVLALIGPITRRAPLFLRCLAGIAVLGGSAAWKFYSSKGAQAHELKLKELELKSQSPSQSPPPCVLKHGELEAKLAALEGKVGQVERKTSTMSLDAPSSDELDERLIKLEQAVKKLTPKKASK